MKKLLFTIVVAMMATAVMAEKQTVRLYIPGMECAHCQEKVENVLNHEKGIKKLTVTLDKRMVEIVYEDKKTNVENIQNALVKELKFKSMVVRDGEAPKACSGQCKHGDGKGCSGQCKDGKGHDHGHGECKGENHDKAHCKDGKGHNHEGECKGHQGQNKTQGTDEQKPEEDHSIQPRVKPASAPSQITITPEGK